MTEQIENSLADIQAQFSDKRTQICALIAAVADDRIQLNGTVLDQATATAVQQQLQDRFPSQPVELADVTILRHAETENLVVNTTLTSLYAEPRFLSEPTTGLLNGETLALLKTEGAWAFVQHSNGYLGWLYRPYLSPPAAAKPTHLVCEPVAPLHVAPTTDAPLVSRVLGGTAVAATQLQNGWACLDLVGDVCGWLPSHSLRPLPIPILPEPQLRQRLVADAHALTGVPYLWGGSSGYGIDCSGFAQLVHRLSGIDLLRDADMQFDNGRPVEPPFQPGDLLFFSSPNGHRRITHVGVSLGGWQLIHSSRSHNGVYVDDVQTVDHLKQTFVGARTYVNG